MYTLTYSTIECLNVYHIRASVTVFMYVYAGEWRGVHSLSLSHTACNTTSYKPLAGNTDMCVLCPANSRAPGPASNSCQCIPGYRRGNVMDITSVCNGMWAVFGPVMLRELLLVWTLLTPTKSVYHDIHLCGRCIGSTKAICLRAQHYWCCKHIIE